MTIQKMKTSILRSAIAAVALAGVLSSCLKSDDDSTPAAPQAFISIMHLAPTAPSLDIFFDNTKVSANPFAPSTVSSAYSAVDRGAFSIQFKKAASDSLVAEVPRAQYDSLKFYTLFIYNLQANGPARAVRIIDDFSALTPDKPYYRFFHASPNTGDIDLYLDNVKIESSRMLADNTANGPLNNFLETTLGHHTIDVRLAGSQTVIATLTNVELLAGNAYTFYLSGLNGGIGASGLTLGVLRAA